MNLRKLILWGCSAMSFLFAQTPACPAKSTQAAVSSAQLSEAHGFVYKRGFQDWQKDQWDDPVPAVRGDILTEGMQIGTGTQSWAQLTWPNITARAWSNSVYAIAPTRRLVYLTGGEMLYHLDKHRKDKDPYYVWTNLLQARIRGTTVLFQCTKNVSRITVLEGVITVLNRRDHSVVELMPGAVYEVRDRTAPTSNREAQSLTPVTVLDQKPAELFSTRDTVTSISQIDPQAVLSHPLLKTFDSRLSSIPLINQSMTTMQSLLKAAIATEGGVLKLLAGSVNVVSLPKTIAYELTPFAVENVSLPIAMMQLFPPKHDVAMTNPNLSPLRLAAFAPGNISVLQSATRASAGFNLGNTAALPSSLNLPSIGGNTAFTAGLPFAGGGAGIVQGTASALSAAQLGTAVGGVSNGAVGGTTGVFSLVGGLANGATNLLQNATSGLLPHFP